MSVKGADGALGSRDEMNSKIRALVAWLLAYNSSNTARLSRILHETRRGFQKIRVFGINEAKWRKAIGG